MYEFIFENRKGSTIKLSSISISTLANKGFELFSLPIINSYNKAAFADLKI